MVCDHWEDHDDGIGRSRICPCFWSARIFFLSVGRLDSS